MPKELQKRIITSILLFFVILYHSKLVIKKHIERKKIKKIDPLIMKKSAIAMIIIELNILLIIS